MQYLYKLRGIYYMYIICFETFNQFRHVKIIINEFK